MFIRASKCLPFNRHRCRQVDRHPEQRTYRFDMYQKKSQSKHGPELSGLYSHPLS